MDKVQIYYATLLILGIFFAGLTHGKERSGEHNAWYDIIGLLVSLPMIGRIFLWW